MVGVGFASAEEEAMVEAVVRMNPTRQALEEVAAARLVWHDAREEGRPAKDLRILWRRLVEAVRAVRGEFRLKPKHRFAEYVNVEVTRNPRHARLRQKQSIEKDLIAEGLQPRTSDFLWRRDERMRQYDLTAEALATAQDVAMKVFTSGRKVPWNDEGVDILRSAFIQILRRKGFENVKVQFEGGSRPSVFTLHAERDGLEVDFRGSIR